jgi:tetratricopeptide (TPR) repeat protein
MRTSLSSTELRLLAGVLCAATLVPPALAEKPGAPAGEQDAFQLHYQAALALYKKDQLEQALAEFKAAYELDALPRLLFNIGQLHKKLGHTKQAVDAYELYLRTDPDLTLKQRKVGPVERAGRAFRSPD